MTAAQKQRDPTYADRLACGDVEVRAGDLASLIVRNVREPGAQDALLKQLGALSTAIRAAVLA